MDHNQFTFLHRVPTTLTSVARFIVSNRVYFGVIGILHKYIARNPNSAYKFSLDTPLPGAYNLLAIVLFRTYMEEGDTL